MPLEEARLKGPRWGSDAKIACILIVVALKPAAARLAVVVVALERVGHALALPLLEASSGGSGGGCLLYRLCLVHALCLIADVFENHIRTAHIGPGPCVVVELLGAVPSVWGEGVELGMDGASSEVLVSLKTALKRH